MTDFSIRTAVPEDAAAIELLVRTHQEEGRLLPRAIDDIRSRVGHFVVCEVDGQVKACAELVRLSTRVAEIRTLVVAGDLRRVGVAARMVGEIRSRAKAAGFDSLVAFTHDARVFVRQNFSIVPHVWVPEKLTKDCGSCSRFRQCGQYAMLLPLAEVVQFRAPAAEPRHAAVA